jgi:lysozyme
MAELSSETRLPGPGPYFARVVNNLDPEFMGSLEVLLYEGTTGDSQLQDNTVTVKYLPSFWGTTNIDFEGNNSSDFYDVQKSYGMWMVPPDVGVVVVCMFIGADKNAGFWLGVVPDRYQDHMVPGIAASQYVAMTPEQERKYGTKNVPVAEFNKSTRKGDGALSPKIVDTFTKPVHPFADRLLAQGLLVDNIRGITSSSARREHPSQVFGISTPGPVDTKPPSGKGRGRIGYTKGDGAVDAFVSRLGGHSLVMDDGDKDGQNELFRIRTRTGHQILLHNSSDLIYIANGAGTAWIELTSQGKIDIYAADSISMHTEGDFNLKADRDFNIEAGRSINMAAGTDFHLDTDLNFILNIGQAGTQTYGQSLDIKATSDMKIQSTGAMDIKAGGTLKVGSSSDVNLAGTDVKVSGSGTLGLSGTPVLISGSEVHLNGPSAPTATQPNPASYADPLPTFNLPNVSPAAGWSDGKFYRTDDIVSIMKRVPTHEPWPQHENINPSQFSLNATDTGNLVGPSPNLAGSTVTYNKAPAESGKAPAPTGNIEEDNIAAFLWMIRCCEGTSGPNGYKTQYTGKLFTSFDDHPREVICAFSSRLGKQLCSSAAGAYQYMPKTWDQVKRQAGLSDFSPKSQDLGCIQILKNRGALEYVKKGEWSKAIERTKSIWASLPGDVYGQGGKSAQQALAYYKQGGGTAIA